MNKDEIKEAVRSARGQSPYSQEQAFATLRQAEIGAPVLVHTPAGEPAYWLVPFIVQGMVCGFAQSSLQGVVMRIGILGGSAGDRAAWVEVAYFEQPPREMLAEIRQHFAAAALPEPVFSYDGSPSKWAWRLSIVKEGAAPAEVFISPSGWVVQRQDERRPNYE